VQAQEQPNSSQVPPVQAAGGQIAEVLPATLLLPEATPVKLKLLHTLNSKTVVIDDPLNFVVAGDLIVNGEIVAKTGAVPQRLLASSRTAGQDFCLPL